MSDIRVFLDLRIDGEPVKGFPRLVLRSGDESQIVDADHDTIDKQTRPADPAGPVLALTVSQRTNVDVISTLMTQQCLLEPGGVVLLTETRALAYKPVAASPRTRVQGVW